MNCGRGRLKHWPSKILVFQVVLYSILRGLPLLQLNTMLGTHADFRKAAEAVSGKFSLLALTWWLLSGRNPNVQVVPSSL